MDAFDAAKERILADLARDGEDYPRVRGGTTGDVERWDKSPKGCLDKAVRELVGAVNQSWNMVTTSSCSGRCSLFQEPSHENDPSETGVDQGLVDKKNVPRKGTGRWLSVNHERCWSGKELAKLVNSADRSTPLVFKTEPFVLHVLCRDAVSAQRLLCAAKETGFRESGLSLGNRKIIVGIRTTANALEVPLILNGCRLMNDESLHQLARTAQAKFDANVARREAFFAKVLELVKEDQNAKDNLHVLEATTAISPRASGVLEWGVLEEGIVQRWGHTATAVDGGSRVLIFGGFGPQNKLHQRLNSVCALTRGVVGWSGCLLNTELAEGCGSEPCARVHHSATCLADHFLVVFGGRKGPSAALNDWHVLDTRDAKWLAVSVPDVAAAIEPRWGHSAVDANGKMYLFGGRDATRLFGDLYVACASPSSSFTVDLSINAPSFQGKPPSPRFGHASVMVGEKLLVTGGYGSLLIDECIDSSILDDVFVLNTETFCWTRVDFSQAYFPPAGRFAHQALSLDSGRALIVGGVCSHAYDGAAQVIDLNGSNARCERVTASPLGSQNDIEKQTMLAKFALVRVADNAILSLGGGGSCFSFGSYFGPSACADINWLSHESALEPNAIAVCASQSKRVKSALEAEKMYDKSRKIAPYVNNTSKAGGKDSMHMAIPFLPGAEARVRIMFPSLPIVWACLPRTLTRQQKQELQKLRAKRNHESAAASGAAKRALVSVPKTDALKLHQQGQEQGQGQEKTRWHQEEGRAVYVNARECKQVKTALEAAGLYNNSYSIGKSATQPEMRAVPVAGSATDEELRAVLAFLERDVEVSSALLSASSSTKAKRQSHQSIGQRKGHVERGKENASTIKIQILEWIEKVVRPAGIGLPARGSSGYLKLEKQIPRKIELLGDVAIIAREYFSEDNQLWSSVFALGDNKQEESCIWAFIAKLARAKRVLLQRTIHPGVKRQSLATLVFPRPPDSSCMVSVRQNGVQYSLDLCKVMFSSGNISEKQRVARFSCLGETVVDLFAGIGYFTLPYLVHTGCSHLHACEWNSDALEALRKNLVLNRVDDARCTVHPGDCRSSVAQALRGIADRVNLGLIPSSEPFWVTGVQALRGDKGGWLHIHENVAQKSQPEWVSSLERALEALLNENHSFSSPWRATCRHLERVKSYSPHVDHIVADVYCTPHSKGVESASFPKSAPIPFALRHDNLVENVATSRPLTRYADYPATRVEALELFASQEPIVFNNAVTVDKLGLWGMDSLGSLCKEQPTSVGQAKVSVHVADSGTNGKISFVDKTFKFKVTTFQALVDSLSHATGEFYYLRSVGTNPRKERAHFWKDYPAIAAHTRFEFPDTLLSKEEEYFSSVLRVASKGLQLWTHYDVMQNVLFQCSGRKRVVVFRPEHAAALDFHGSSSSIVDIDAAAASAPDSPFARARAAAYEIELLPGQALFIPALWPHNVLALESSVAVNVFWKGLSMAHYGGKDLYGNRDPLLAEEALGLIARANDLLNAAQDDGTTLPQQYIDFYSSLGASKLAR